MIVQNESEVEILKAGGSILARALNNAVLSAKPGVKTKDLDKIIEKDITSAGAKPSFKNYSNKDSKSSFPFSSCISINDEVVHGIPGDRALKDGDVLSIDVGVEFGGLFTDSAITVAVGRVDEKAKKMIYVCEEALRAGIKQIKAGSFTGDYGVSVREHAERNGFRVIKELVGHGVGKAVHEEPEVPNWGFPGKGVELEEGMVLALEPMITKGLPGVVLNKDGWTWRTKDGSRSAHFEHTVLITKNGAQILTGQ